MDRSAGAVLLAVLIPGAAAGVAACVFTIDESRIADADADARETRDASGDDGASGDAADAPDARGGDAGCDAPSSYFDNVMCDGPLAYWRLGESALPTAHDARDSFPGTFGTGITLGAKGALSGDSDTAVTFGGTGAIDVPGKPLLFGGSNAATFEAWIRPTTVVSGAYYCFLSNDVNVPDGGRLGYALCVSTNGLGFERHHGAHEEIDAVFPGSGAPPASGYTHIVGTYDGSNMRLYVNGQLHGAPVGSNASIDDHALDFTIGGRPGGNLTFVGDVDEVAVYGHALGAERVLAHFHASGRP